MPVRNGEISPRRCLFSQARNYEGKTDTVE